MRVLSFRSLKKNEYGRYQRNFEYKFRHERYLFGVFALDELPKSQFMADRWFLVCITVAQSAYLASIGFYYSTRTTRFSSLIVSVKLLISTGWRGLFSNRIRVRLHLTKNNSNRMHADILAFWSVTCVQLGETMEVVRSNLRHLDGAWMATAS